MVTYWPIQHDVTMGKMSVYQVAVKHINRAYYFCLDIFELISPGAKSQKMHQTRFRLLRQVGNVSWFYLIETPFQTIIISLG